MALAVVGAGLESGDPGRDLWDAVVVGMDRATTPFTAALRDFAAQGSKFDRPVVTADSPNTGGAGGLLVVV